MTLPATASDKRTTLIAIALMVLASVAVAIMTNSPKLAFLEGSNPVTVITIRAIIAALTLGVCILLTRGKFRLPWNPARLSICSGMLSAAMLHSSFNAIRTIGVSLTILVIFVNPFLIGAYNHITGISHLTSVAVISGLVAFVGLGFALAVDFSTLDPLGLTLAGLAAIFAAAMVIVTMRLSMAVGALTANFHMVLWSLILIVVVMFLTDDWQPPDSTVGWGACIANGLAFAFAYLTFFAAAKLIGLTRVSMLSFMEPVTTILLAAYMFQEYLSTLQWGGVALVAAGLFFMEAPLARSSRQS